MHETQASIDQLILDIHAAPFEPDRWQPVIASLCRIHCADKAQLFSSPRTQDVAFWGVSVGVSPEASLDYLTEFAPEDVWLRAGRERGISAPGVISLGEDLVDRHEYLRTRFYNEFLAPHGFDRFMNVVLRAPIDRGSPPTAMLSLYREVGKDAFGSLEQDTLGRLTPHLILAINTFWRVRELALRSALLSKTLDAVTAPLFIIDRSGCLVFANAAGEAVLRADDCLRLVGGCLTPAPSVRERKVCMDALRRLRTGLAATVALTVGVEGRTRILSTAPISESADTFAPWGSSAGLVWLVPVTQTTNPVKRIANLFALTMAEERLLARLSASSNLTETAEALCISIHTARSQLKAIQRKTGWRSQGELIRMVQQLGVISPQRESKCY